MSVSQKSLDFAREASAWFRHSSADIALAILAGLAIAAIMLAVRAYGHRLVRERHGAIDWRTLAGRVLAKTSLFFVITCSTALVAENAQTPPALLRGIHFLFVIAAVVQAALWVRELILGYIEHRVGEEEAHSTLGTAVGLIRLLVTIALFAVALILILDNLGVNVTGLVAGLGIGGIAIGLAAQGIFSDLFAALSIIFDKPFRRGDGIRFEGITGTVEQIGLKTTRVRSLSGEQVVVSNAKLLEKQIHNFTQLEHRRFLLPFGLVYQTPPETCAGVPAMLREIVDAHPEANFVRCGMIGFGPSSLDFDFQFDVHGTDYETAFATRGAICLEILRAFANADIAFAYPTQTSFTAAPDGSFVLPYAEPGQDER